MRALPLAALLLLGCTGQTEDKAPTDSNSSVDDSVPIVDSGLCDEAPVVTWANFGQGFITENCQGCHASTAIDRYGAPESVTFDDLEEVWAQSDRILARSTGDSPTMPPAGGVSEDDRTRLVWWLECAEEGT